MNAHVEALGWALLHSLWQGAALWLVLEAALAWPRVVSPRVRGRLAGAALALFVVAVAGTYGWVVKTERAASLATISVSSMPRPTIVLDKILPMPTASTTISSA